MFCYIASTEHSCDHGGTYLVEIQDFEASVVISPLRLVFGVNSEFLVGVCFRDFGTSVVISPLRIVLGVTLGFVIGVCCKISGRLSSLHGFAVFGVALEFVIGACCEISGRCRHFIASHCIWSESEVLIVLEFCYVALE